MATEVLVPPLGQTVDTLVLVNWYKQEGEPVTQGEPLFAVETDKATLDVEAPASGILRRVSAPVGTEVKVLSVIALIASASEEPLPPVNVDFPEAAPPESIIERIPLRPAGAQKRLFISPRARRLAEEQHVPTAALHGSGPEGAVVERDVRAWLESRPTATPMAARLAEEAGIDLRSLAKAGGRERITREDVLRAARTPEKEGEVLEIIPFSGIRGLIADRMAQSSVTTAPVTLNSEADVTALLALRRQLAHDGIVVSINDLFLSILGKALQENPRLNASLTPEGIQVWRRIDIALAVDTERGLMAPVIRRAPEKGLAQLAAETKELIERARKGQCKPEELSGGTFTMTNLGMFGVDQFNPIINLPECAILGIGQIKKRPVVIGEAIHPRDTTWLSLTFDHRLVDGGPAARFLQRLVQLMERPHLLLA